MALDLGNGTPDSLWYGQDGRYIGEDCCIVLYSSAQLKSDALDSSPRGIEGSLLKTDTASRNLTCMFASVDCILSLHHFFVAVGRFA